MKLKVRGLKQEFKLTFLAVFCKIFRTFYLKTITYLHYKVYFCVFFSAKNVNNSIILFHLLLWLHIGLQISKKLNSLNYFSVRWTRYLYVCLTQYLTMCILRDVFLQLTDWGCLSGDPSLVKEKSTFFSYEVVTVWICWKTCTSVVQHI